MTVLALGSAVVAAALSLAEQLRSSLPSSSQPASLRELLDARDGAPLRRGRGSRPPVRLCLRADQPRLGAGPGAGRRRRRRPGRGHLRRSALPAALRSGSDYVCRPMEIREAPRSEPRRDRGAHLPRLRRSGIATVAVAAPDDAGAFHTRVADETVEIQSYLLSEEHIRAAKSVGADAIHPGYGFLAENPTSPRPSRQPASSSSGRRRTRSARAATSSRRSGSRRRRACRCSRPASRTRSASRSSSRRPRAEAAAACASSATRRSSRRRREAARREAKAAFGDDTRLLRALRRAAASRRDPAARGRARRGRRPRRARLLDPAPAPEGARGVALPRARPRAPSADERGRGRASAARSATAAPAPSSSCSTGATSTSSS